MRGVNGALVALVVMAGSARAESWSSVYGGLQFGAGSATLGGAASGQVSRDAGGGFLGVQVDFGRTVLGAEAAFGASAQSGGVPATGMVLAKLRVGRDLGHTLLIGSVGAAEAQTDILGQTLSGTGWLIGIGVERRVGRNHFWGLDLTQQIFNDFGGSGINLHVSTVTLRAGLRF